MRKSYDELSWGCPGVWASHPWPARRVAEVVVTRADRLAIAADCRRRQAAHLRDVMARRWPAMFWGQKRQG